MISLTVATAKALIKFASSDKTRPNLYGIGITSRGLAATDGFAALEFVYPPEVLHMYQNKYIGRVIDRKLFETSMKLAAVTKSPMTVSPEHFIEEQLVFPSLSPITPTDEFPLLMAATDPSARYIDHPVTVVADYFGLLPLVATACESDCVSLSSVKSDSPLRFDVTGATQSAIVIINRL